MSVLSRYNQTDKKALQAKDKINQAKKCSMAKNVLKKLRQNQKKVSPETM